MTTPVILPPERAGEAGAVPVVYLPDGSVMIVPRDPPADPYGQIPGALIAAAGDFDESKVQRDGRGRFAETGDDATFVTRTGPDMPSGGNPEFAAEANERADAHGAVSLHDAQTAWQDTYSASREIQEAADALLGYADPGSVSDEALANAREVLAAMSGETAGTTLTVNDAGDLARGFDDPDGQIVAALQEAHDSGAPIEWSMASFVQGGTAGAASPALNTNGTDRASVNDLAAEFALNYAGAHEDAEEAAGVAPVLMQASGEALTLGGVESVMGGRFTVEEIRDATDDERDRWEFNRNYSTTTPLTIVKVRQVDNVRMPSALSAAADPSLVVFVHWRDGSLGERSLTDAGFADELAHVIDLFAFDPDQPRDESGRWTSDGGGSAEGGGGSIEGPGGQVIELRGTRDGRGTPDNPRYVDGDIQSAVAAMARGESVRLDEEKQASVLVAELGTYAKQVRDRGEEAPNFDLCTVTVGDSNVFCEGNLGQPRISMPQLRGFARDGSPAAELRRDPSNSSERVAAETQYEQALADSGVRITNTRVPADMLRATQNELNGGKVGAIYQKIQDGTFTDDQPIWITKDGYVLDGHHRWAAVLAHDLNDGKRGDVDIQVNEVDMEIGAALDFTRQWGKEFGIVQEGLELRKTQDIAASGFDEEQHPRDEHGRFTDGGGSGDARTDALAAEWQTNERSVREEMSRAGNELIGLPNDREQIAQEVRMTVKAGVAQDIARSMTTSTERLAETQEVAFADQYRAAVERPDDFLVLAPRADSPGGVPSFIDISTLDEGSGWGDLAITEESLARWRETGIIMGGRAYRPDSEEGENLVREGVTSSLVARWASTANDNNPTSLAMQRAAQETFGLKGTAGWEADWAEVDVGGEAEFRANGDVYSDFLRAQYDNTQGFLKGEGITEMTLVRGWNWEDPADAPDWALGEPRVETIATRPMSSWTSDSQRAEVYTNAGAQMLPQMGVGLGAVTYARIPAERILSIPLTGLGALPEREFVVLGGDQPVYVTKTGDPSTSIRAAGPPSSRTPYQVAVQNEDWIRTLAWDLPTTVDGLERHGLDVNELVRLPAGQAMPPELRVAANLPSLREDDQQ